MLVSATRVSDARCDELYSGPVVAGGMCGPVCEFRSEMPAAGPGPEMAGARRCHIFPRMLTISIPSGTMKNKP